MSKVNDPNFDKSIINVSPGSSILQLHNLLVLASDRCTGLSFSFFPCSACDVKLAM